eukprot:6597271-Alexandrium_andersonii.AAC.1
MSASLVGSEMCIRDRDSLASVQLGCSAQAATSRHEAAEARNRAGRGPVSYTHLTLPTICSV